MLFIMQLQMYVAVTHHAALKLGTVQTFRDVFKMCKNCHETLPEDQMADCPTEMQRKQHFLAK